MVAVGAENMASTSSAESSEDGAVSRRNVCGGGGGGNGDAGPPKPRPASHDPDLVEDINSKFCGRADKTCCSVEMEESLKDMAKNDYERVVKKVLLNVSRMFKSKSTKFNEYFKDLLSKSKKDFHEMFKKTYGMVYEQNSYVFSDFFGELEKYFTYGKSNLAEVMDTFFNILYQKMFIVMNSQFKFDEKYLGCVSEHMNELKPFGDVPQKLSLPLKRSFVAARIYWQSLNIVGEIVNNLVNLMPSENCFNAMTKMSHCSVCKGLPNAKVCHGFCLNIMKGCLAFHSELDAEWNTFVDALHKVQQRLLGPFNLELVVEPINVKISEAIMNFQENANHVSTKVFNGCGKPPLPDNRRRRRQANGYRKEQRNSMRTDGEESNEPRRKNKNNGDTNPNRSHNRNERGRRRGNKGTASEDGDDDTNPYKSSPIDGFLKFIQEIGESVLSTKYFWKRLPYNICSDEMNVEKNRSASCWNGNAIGNYAVPEVQDGLKNQEFNHEVSVDPKRKLTTVSEQLYTLNSVTLQLKNAYNGQDVEFIDNEEGFDSSSGSGMYPDLDNMGSLNPIEGSGFEPPFKYSTRFSDASTPSTAVGSDHETKHTDAEVPTSSVPSTENASPTWSTVDGESSSTLANDFNVTGTKSYNVTTSDGTTIRYDRMSLNQALTTYLLPTVVMWVGGSFNKWFHTFEGHFAGLISVGKFSRQMFQQKFV